MRIVTLLAALSLLVAIGAPPALAAADAVAPPTYTCNPNGGLVGVVECDVLGIACAVVVFLLGPGSCA